MDRKTTWIALDAGQLKGGCSRIFIVSPRWAQPAPIGRNRTLLRTILSSGTRLTQRVAASSDGTRIHEITNVATFACSTGLVVLVLSSQTFLTSSNRGRTSFCAIRAGATTFARTSTGFLAIQTCSTAFTDGRRGSTDGGGCRTSQTSRTSSFTGFTVVLPCYTLIALCALLHCLRVTNRTHSTRGSSIGIGFVLSNSTTGTNRKLRHRALTGIAARGSARYNKTSIAIVLAGRSMAQGSATRATIAFSYAVGTHVAMD